MTMNCISESGRIGYSSGPFCRVLFSLGPDGLQTYTHRSRVVADGPGVLVDSLVVCEDDRHFHRMFINTSYIPVHRSTQELA